MSELQKIKYAIRNLVDEDTLIGVYSEDTVYVMENLYNARPSKPYRATGIGAPGTPEWVCVTFPAARTVSLVALFNHNLTMLTGVGDELRIKGCDLGCESPECNWDAPDDEIDISGSLFEMAKADRATFENLYYRTKLRRANIRLDIVDQNNEDGYIEIGEYFLGNWENFSENCFVSPGRPDSPEYFKGDQSTFMGQDWISYYSKAESFTLSFTNLNSRETVNEMKIFLDRVQQNGGIFVIIPDKDSKIVFLVKITDYSGYGNRIIYGDAGEMKTWNIPLKTLTTGIKLL